MQVIFLALKKLFLTNPTLFSIGYPNIQITDREDNQIDFDEGMQEIIEKLIILREHGNMYIAIEAGEQIIEELRHMAGHDEDFPLLDIDILSRVIHKYR